MNDPIIDHDRLDVYRLSFEYVATASVHYTVAIDYEHEHRDAEHEHERGPEPSRAPQDETLRTQRASGVPSHNHIAGGARPTL